MGLAEHYEQLIAENGAQRLEIASLERRVHLLEEDSRQVRAAAVDVGLVLQAGLERLRRRVISLP
jgi:hypothetical protein